MFQGDPNIRGEGEKIDYTPEMMQEYIRCSEDLIYFAEKYFHITSIDEGRQKIKLWDFQKRILKAFVEPPDGKRHICLLSSRQIGKTTVSRIFIIHYILFNADKNVALLADREKTALKILRELKSAYKELPIWLQQGILSDGWNALSLRLENGTNVTASSTASTAMRGEAISLLYLDEFAFVPRNIADDFMASVYPTIASGKTAKIIAVSTPNGLNHFYNLWRQSVRGENNFKAVKVRWDEIPGRDEAWKESVIKDIGIIRWNAEFAAKFIGSSNTLIDGDLLERIEVKDPIDVKWNGLFMIYEHPRKDATYILGVDTAKGTARDYSVIQVLRVDSEVDIEQVAVYRCNTISPFDYAQVCIQVSEYYNGAYLMVESNGVGQSTCDTIWYTYEYDKILNCDAKGLGILATRKTKLAGNMLLKRYIENGWLKINDKNTLLEISKYEEVSIDIFSAKNGENDDAVMALMWAVYFLTTTFYDGKTNDVKKIDPKFRLDGTDYEEDAPVIVFDDQGGVNFHQDQVNFDEDYNRRNNSSDEDLPILF